MAPDYDKPHHHLEVSNLFRSLHLKLKDYILPGDLYDQLCLAYYTYDPRLAHMAFSPGNASLGNAFQWDATCQGQDFWQALDALTSDRIDEAIELLEGTINDD